MSRPIIGRQYAPTHFETRDRDGTYRCLRPRAMSQSELRLQSALIGRKHKTTSLVDYMKALLWK